MQLTASPALLCILLVHRIFLGVLSVLEHKSTPTAIRMSLVVGDQDDQRRESKKENLYEFVQASSILYGALAQLEVPSIDNLTPVTGR